MFTIHSSLSRAEPHQVVSLEMCVFLYSACMVEQGCDCIGSRPLSALCLFDVVMQFFLETRRYHIQHLIGIRSHYKKIS